MVQGLRRLFFAVDCVAFGYRVFNLGACEQVVSETHLCRQRLVEDDAANGGLDDHASVVPHADGFAELDLSHVVGQAQIGKVGVRGPVCLLLAAFFRCLRGFCRLVHARQVVDTKDHVECWGDDWLTRTWCQHVVGAQHQALCFYDRLTRKRYVDSHLVTVKVCVESRADERVQVDGTAFNDNWLECLDTEPVQCWCTVQQHRVVLDDFLKDVPDFRTSAFSHALCALDVVSIALHDKSVHNERLEQFKCHLLRQTTLVELERGPGNDDRAAGVVHALTQQVLAEPSLLAT